MLYMGLLIATFILRLKLGPPCNAVANESLMWAYVVVEGIAQIASLFLIFIFLSTSIRFVNILNVKYNV